jgi:hypothetical protein
MGWVVDDRLAEVVAIQAWDNLAQLLDEAITTGSRGAETLAGGWECALDCPLKSGNITVMPVYGHNRILLRP